MEQKVGDILEIQEGHKNEADCKQKDASPLRGKQEPIDYYT